MEGLRQQLIHHHQMREEAQDLMVRRCAVVLGKSAAQVAQAAAAIRDASGLLSSTLKLELTAAGRYATQATEPYSGTMMSLPKRLAPLDAQECFPRALHSSILSGRAILSTVKENFYSSIPSTR
ncbi:hypothetical protein ACP70R_014722 [Stipagrostis hirtigluma subsp. patula]